MLQLHKGVVFARRNAAREISSPMFDDGYATDGDNGGIMTTFVDMPQTKAADAAGLRHGRR